MIIICPPFYFFYTPTSLKFDRKATSKLPMKVEYERLILLQFQYPNSKCHEPVFYLPSKQISAIQVPQLYYLNPLYDYVVCFGIRWFKKEWV